MKLLNKISTPPSYIRRHNEIVDAKTNAVVKQELIEIKSGVTRRYREFQSAVRLRTILTVQQDQVFVNSKTNLLSCYKTKSVKTRKIFSDIETAQIVGTLGKCPYCGITRPNTYDHYLPEDIYPEFAVHALNLIPCCAECNSSKGTNFVQNGQRQYLHLYSDPFPEEQFLFVTINTRPNSAAYGVTFSLRKPAQFNQDKWNVIDAHFRKLRLINRYQNEANDEISTVFDISKAHISAGGNDVGNFLNAVCVGEEVKFGMNHWRVVLKRSLAQTQEFINYVNTEANAV
ncbi:MAG: 5-methylcytosine-specific restriction endonuclease McrA [Oleiphilaceae bacterium]|jgi:5-methylcytosine-specific restriction endonuclease McrA